MRVQVGFSSGTRITSKLVDFPGCNEFHKKRVSSHRQMQLLSFRRKTGLYLRDRQERRRMIVLLSFNRNEKDLNNLHHREVSSNRKCVTIHALKVRG